MGLVAQRKKDVMDELAIIASGPGSALGVVRNVIVILARRARTVTEDLRGLESLGTALQTARAHDPEHVAMLSVYEPGAPTMSPEVRDSVAEMYRGLGGRVMCVARVVEGEGFLAAVLHGMLATIVASAKLSAPVRHFTTVTDATKWMGEMIEPEMTGLLRDAVARLRIQG